MKAVPLAISADGKTLAPPQKWVATIDGRTFYVWVGEDGIHFHEVDSGRPRVSPRAEIVLSYADAVAKAEHQLTLL